MKAVCEGVPMQLWADSTGISCKLLLSSSEEIKGFAFKSRNVS